MKNDTGFIKIGLSILILGFIFVGALYYKNRIDNKPNRITKTANNSINIGKISLPSKTKLTAYLETTKGNIELASVSYDSNDQYKHDLKNKVQYLYEKNNYLYFSKNNNLNRLNKNTKEVTEYKLPFIKNQNTGSELIAYFTELNNGKAYVAVQDLNMSYEGFPYILDLDSKVFTPIYLDEKYCEMCGAPYLEKILSNNKLLLGHSGGDACWSRGNIFLYTIDENKSEKILEYEVGCYDDKDAYLGFVNNKLITAKHVSSIYSNLNLINPYTKVTTQLLSAKDMPKNINRITPDKDKGLIYLYDSDNQRYTYNIGKKTLGAAESNFEKETTEEITIKPEYKVKEEITTLGKITQVRIKERDLNSPYNRIEVTDEKGISANLLEIPVWQQKYDTYLFKGGQIPDCEIWSEYYFKEVKLEKNQISMEIEIKPQNQIERCSSIHKEGEKIRSYIDLDSGNIFVY